MTEGDFQRQQEHLLDWINKAQDDKERQAAHLALNDLWQLRAKMWNRSMADFEEKPKRKPRKKLTVVEKYDKKNSRRDAIMAQRERHGTGIR